SASRKPRALVEEVVRDKGGADHARRRAQLRPDDLDTLVRGRERIPSHCLARRIEQEVTGCGEAAADHDDLGTKNVHEAPDRGAELAADPVEDLDRSRIALAGEADESMGIDCGTECLLRKLRRGLPAHVCLEVPAACAGPLTGDAVVDEHRVAELAPVP